MTDKLLVTSNFSYREIKDEDTLSRYGISAGYKMFLCSIRINGEKWKEHFILSEDFMRDSAISWERCLELEMTEHAKTDYLEKEKAG
jgi:hypothetical protein